MAANKSGQRTFPVWVGSLKDTVGEKHLRKMFGKYGNIDSVKLKRDETTGKSKGFGWVNFTSRDEAERAATKMAGVAVHGMVIKTTGPTELERKGLLSPTSLTRKDFRPLTDCSFYIQGKNCKNGDAVSCCLCLYMYKYTVHLRVYCIPVYMLVKASGV